MLTSFVTYNHDEIQSWPQILTLLHFYRQLQIFIFSLNNTQMDHQQTYNWQSQTLIIQSFLHLIIIIISTHAPGGPCWLHNISLYIQKLND